MSDWTHGECEHKVLWMNWCWSCEGDRFVIAGVILTAVLGAIGYGVYTTFE